MQKHRRFMMFFIFIFVGLPLALFIPGVGSSNRDGELAGANTPVVTVGNVSISAAEFLQVFNRYVDARRIQGLSTNSLDLLADGTVDEIVEGLIQSAVIRRGASANAVLPEQNYLAKRLKDEGSFKNENGEFVPSLYNDWVENQTRRGMNWDAFYADYAVGVSQTIFPELVLASPRVFEAEMRDTFMRDRRKMKVKYVTVEPAVDLDEEDLRAHYEDNKENYMTDEERAVQYVAFSIQTPIPETAEIAVERARAGEEFVDLVEAYSVGTDKASGGDMGWIPVTETPTEQQEAIFALKEGETSDPFRSFNEVHVYHVVEERINEEDDTMEVHARRIVFRPVMSAEERAAIQDKATSFLSSVNEADGGDFSAVATAAGLSLETSGLFSRRSGEISTVKATDVSGFRLEFMRLEKDAVSEVVNGRDHLFVGKVVSVLEPRQQIFEEAREDIERDATNLYKNGPDYVGQVSDYISKISSEAKSLSDIATLIPRLNAEVKETREFGMTDFLFSDGLFWNMRDVFALMGNAQPGEMKGPMADFQQISHFLELVETIDPDPAVVNPEWELQKDSILENRLSLIQRARQADYLQFISEKAQVGGEVFRNKSAIQALLGIDSEADAEPELTEVPGDSTPESENSESNQSDGDSGSDDDDNVEEGDPVTEEVEN
jgi:hypothetical protein